MNKCRQQNKHLTSFFVVFVVLTLQNVDASARVIEKIITDQSEDTVSVANADVILLKFQTRLGTGYAWFIARIDEDLVKEQGNPKFESPQAPAFGSVSYKAFKLLVIHARETVVAFEYRAPGTEEPTKTYRLRLEKGAPH